MSAGGTTLLRRYHVKPGHWDAFLAMWGQVAAIRWSFGFEIRFAYADRHNDVFTWSVSHAGDIDAVHARYYADPERAALAGITEHPSSWEITPVESLPLQAT